MDFKLQPLNIKFQNLTYRVSKNNGKWLNCIKLHPCTFRHSYCNEQPTASRTDFSMSNLLELELLMNMKNVMENQMCGGGFFLHESHVGCGRMSEQQFEHKRRVLVVSMIFQKLKCQCQLPDYEHASIGYGGGSMAQWRSHIIFGSNTNPIFCGSRRSTLTFWC